LFKIVKWFENSFGLDQLKKLLLLRDDRQRTIIFQFFANYRNSIDSGLKILKYLKTELKLDQNFLKKELILRKTKSNENILRLIFLRSENFDEFNDFIENQFNISNSELKTLFVGNERARSWKRIVKFFVQPIFSLLKRTDLYELLVATLQTSLSPIHFHIAQKSEEDQEKFLDFMKRRFGDDILNELISHKTLCEICLHSDLFDDFGTKVLRFFDFVERNFGIEFLKKLIFYKTCKQRTFLFHLFQVADKDLVKIFNYLFEKFKNEKKNLEQFLLSVDYADGNTFLIYHFQRRNTLEMIENNCKFFELIKTNFGLKFLKKLLLIKNKKKHNYHHSLLLTAYAGGVEESLEVLEILLKVVGKDKRFFIKLAKQNEEIPDQIKEFLERNLEIGPLDIRFRNCELFMQPIILMFFKVAWIGCIILVAKTFITQLTHYFYFYLFYIIFHSIFLYECIDTNNIFE
jgi:hypothetical protein